MTCILNDDVLFKIYDYDLHLFPINKSIQMYVKEKKDRAARIIQKMIRNTKIYPQMPILFLNDFVEKKIPKWLLIRIYMKFYPKEDLIILPRYLLKSNYSKEHINNDIRLKKIWDKYNKPENILDNTVTKFEIFNIMHNDFTIEQIVKAGY